MPFQGPLLEGELILSDFDSAPSCILFYDSDSTFRLKQRIDLYTYAMTICPLLTY
jgi:hypothetical protein